MAAKVAASTAYGVSELKRGTASRQVPLRRVNQAYVIATSTSVDVGSVDVAKFDDGYFKAEKKERTKKGEDGFFAEAEPAQKV